MDAARNEPRAGPPGTGEPARHVQPDANPTESRSSFTLARPADELASVAELLGMLPDPSAEIELRRQLAREAYERGRADGRRQGYERAEADIARHWHQIAEPIARVGIRHAELEARRWGPGGRGRFGDPRPGDRPAAEIIARAHASWGPRLVSPGMVHLGGSAVHGRHACTSACYSYREGWYTPERAAVILATLPGDYRDAIAELRRRATGGEAERAA